MGLFDRLRKRRTPVSWALKHLNTEQGVRYYWSSDDGAKPLNDEDARQGATGPDRLLLADLDLLQDEGILQDDTLPLDVVADLDDNDLKRLRLEVSRGWQAEARPQNAIGRGNPAVGVNWTGPDGEFFAGFESSRFRRVPCGFWDDEKRQLHILPRPMLEMRALVASQPARFARASAEYGFLQKVQELAEDGTVASELGALRLDDQLQREQYVVPRPEDVQAEVRKTEDGGLAISPTMPGHESFESGQELLTKPLTEVAFRQTGPDGLHRERIAYEEAVLDRIETIKAVARVAPEDVSEFAKDPGRFIAERAAAADPRLADVAGEMDFGRAVECVTELDLTSFGPRVAGEVEYEPAPSYEPRVVESNLVGELLGEMGRAVPNDEEDDYRPQRQRILETADNLDEVRFAAQASEALRAQLTAYPTPASFRGTLAAHQQEGYVWLRNLWDAADAEDLGQGGVLADEMGLGKTVQVAALIAHLKETNQLRPALVVAPATVTQNWPSELLKFVGPGLRVLEHAGASRTREAAAVAQHDVVLVTYDTLVRDQQMFARVPFKLLVLDEAHYIKNQGVKRSRACRALQADLRIALTATPVENRLEELWAIVEFAQPGLLGSLRDFCAATVQPIDEGGAEAGAAAQGLLERLGPHYLRRTKRQVIDLPEKRVNVVPLKMSPAQLEIYAAVRARHQTLGKGALAAIHDLVRVAAHPAAAAELAEELGLEQRFAEITASQPAFLEASPKFRFMIEKLREIHAAGEKAVVFTSARAVQPLVQLAIHDEFGFRPAVLHGEHSARARFREIERFNDGSGFDVMVLSAQAVGLGVNITSANHVFHLTREWNPSKEAQATDRVHRIGQTRPVHVWIPIVTDSTLLSVDERIEEIMQRKGALAESVIRPSANLSFSAEDIALGVLDDLDRAEAEAEVVRQEVVQAQEVEVMRQVVREPVRPVVQDVPEHPVAQTQKIETEKLFARAILDHPDLSSRIDGGAGASERAIMVLHALLSQRRIHTNEIAREADIGHRRLRGVLSALKKALNHRQVAVLASDGDYFHLNLEALEREYGLRLPA